VGESVRAGTERGGVTPPTPDPLPDGPPVEKRKAGRPSKLDKAAEEKATLVAESAQRETEAVELATIATEALAIPFALVAERRGEHWALSDKEKDQFSLAVSRVVVKYLPGMLLKYKEETALVLIAASIFIPRLREDKSLAAAERGRVIRRDGDSGMRQDDTGEVDPRAARAG
jgi:hypothetical protein